MKKDKFAVKLGLFFILAVIIPSLILSLLAVRAVNREALYIEKRLKTTLTGELNNVALLLDVELDKIQNELYKTISYSPDSEFTSTTEDWKRASQLVESPFLVSASYEILWPKIDTQVSKDEYGFLKANKDFLTDEARIPVYKNIAYTYQEEILKDSQALSSDKQWVGKGAAVKENTFWGKSSSYVNSQENENSPQQQSPYTRQQAQSAFDQESTLREKVYEQAKMKGQSVSYRKTFGSESLNKKETEQARPAEKSIFISEPQKFSQITASGTHGISPRFIDDRLRLLFWKKVEGGAVAGCMINQVALQERLVGALPDIYSQVRVLTILNENGQPLITPVGKAQRDWRKPFVSKEISELLPHWEVAAYLSDPTLISSQANFATTIIWLAIAILFISIITGGTLILKAIHSEISLARQKTTFVTNVSHELKTPLTSIRMFAEMLKEKTHFDEEKRKKYFDIMVSETERLTRLINNVLDFSRLEQNKKSYSMKVFDIVPLYRDLLEGQRVRLESAGFKINFKTQEKNIFVNGDDEALKQGLLNLIFNAEKYSPQTKEIEVEILSDAGNVTVLIRDRGIGVPSSDLDKIFDEFYRVDDSLSSKIKGTGLGLSITRRIIRDHGGDVECLRREGSGSIFKVVLPKVEVKT